MPQVETDLPEISQRMVHFTAVVCHELRTPLTSVNALKYGAGGQRVDVHARADEDSLVIEVQDYGRGVSLWDRMRIFEQGPLQRHGPRGETQ